MRATVAALTVAFLALTAPAGAMPLVRMGADEAGSVANTTAARDAFRTDLGGGTTAGAAGSFGGLRREINWDGVPATASAPNPFPGTFFLDTSPRGILLSNNASGTFEVSGDTRDSGAGQPAAANFGDLETSNTTRFTTFSPQRLFTGKGDVFTSATFFVPNTSQGTPAVIRGFGAVFTDVDMENTSRIEFFDTSNYSLGAFYVPRTPTTGTNGGMSFLGVSFPDGPPIAKVEITAGNTGVNTGITEDATHDLVVMDDFLYSEPTPAGADGDGVPDGSDNCPAAYNPNQLDTDGDAAGDACDTDDDGDGISDADEAARGTSPLKADTDGDTKNDNADNCPLAANADQADADGDGIGNACDQTPNPPPAPDVTPPVLSKVKLNPARFKRSRGTKLTLTLSEPATVKLTIKRGTKVQKRYTRTGKLGPNTFTLKPKLKRGKLYKLTIAATDAAGNKSKAKTLTFRIR
jgi:hypothetical protein